MNFKDYFLKFKELSLHFKAHELNLKDFLIDNALIFKEKNFEIRRKDINIQRIIFEIHTFSFNLKD